MRKREHHQANARLVLLMMTLYVLSVRVDGAARPRPPYEIFRVRTSNVPEAEIVGWLLPTEGAAKGTLIACHGFAGDKRSLVDYQWIRDREGWNLILFDFREHGESTNVWSELRTLGYHEIWDVKAVVDWAERR